MGFTFCRQVRPIGPVPGEDLLCATYTDTPINDLSGPESPPPSPPSHNLVGSLLQLPTAYPAYKTKINLVPWGPYTHIHTLASPPVTGALGHLSGSIFSQSHMLFTYCLLKGASAGDSFNPQIGISLTKGECRKENEERSREPNIVSYGPGPLLSCSLFVHSVSKRK